MKLDSAGNVYCCGPRRHPRLRSRRPAAEVSTPPSTPPTSPGATTTNRSLFVTASTSLYRIRRPIPGLPSSDHQEAFMHRRTLIIVLLAAALAVPLGAEAQKPIKVGMPMPLSGPPALFRRSGVPRARRCTWTRSTQGRRARPQARADSCATPKADANEAVRQARELILKDNVEFLVGTLTSAEGPAVSVVAKENKVVFIAPIPKTDQSRRRTSCIPTSSAWPRTRRSRAAARPRSSRSGR